MVINTFISENMTNLFIEGILIFPVTHAILKTKKEYFKRSSYYLLQMAFVALYTRWVNENSVYLLVIYLKKDKHVSETWKYDAVFLHFIC